MHVNIAAALLAFSCAFGTLTASGCEKNIRIAEPRHSASTNPDQIYVLTIDQSLNATKCVWKFLTTGNFLLNLFFLNFTSSIASAGSDCRHDHAIVKTISSESNITRLAGFYCGQKINGIRIDGIISIELVAEKLENVAGLSLAVLIEASSKKCGGIQTMTSGGYPVDFNPINFGMSRYNFAHCVWYFELDTAQNLELFVSQYTFYHDTHYKCASSNEFLSIRSWNATNGGQRNEIFKCKKFDYTFPLLISLSNNNRFAIVIHFERYYNVGGEIKTLALFPSLGQSTPTLDLDGNGNVTYEKLLNSTDHATSGSIVTSLKPYYDGYQIFGVIEKSTMICTSVQFEIWYLGDRAFERNSTSCTALSQDDVITFKAQTMAILYFEAQERFLRNLQIYYFSSGTECGELLSLRNGQSVDIFSPKTASGTYPPNVVCQWAILVPEFAALNVSLAFMDIENCHTKFYDYIEIYQGFRKGLKLRTRTCTNSIKNFNFTGDVTIRFHSDGVDQRKGFHIIVHRIEDGQGQASTTATTTQRSTTTMRLSTSTVSPAKTVTMGTKQKCCTTKPFPVTKGKEQTVKTPEKSTKTKGSQESAKLYAIGISFGSLALALLIVISIIYSRRKKRSSVPTHIISNEMYLSNSCIVNEDKNREGKSEEIPMENIYDYAQTRAVIPEVDTKVENAYDYAKNTDIIPFANGEIVYERMDSQSHLCSPKHNPTREKHVSPVAPPLDDTISTSFTGFPTEVIYQQPGGPDIIYQVMDYTGTEVYSSASNDQYVAPDQL